MISLITGILIDKQPTYAIIDIQGLGYELFISTQTFYNLPEINKKTTLFVQPIIREDTHSLFGFFTIEEREIFRQLIKISGIGAKTTLSILSVFDKNELINNILEENITKLSIVPGIGKKSAERLVVELKDKFSKLYTLAGDSSKVHAHKENDVINTLLALGYNQKEAILATKDISPDIDISEGVRLALKNISK